MRDHGRATKHTSKNETTRLLSASGDRGLLFDPIMRKWQGVQFNASCTSPDFIDKSIAQDVPPQASKKNNQIWRRSLTLVTESTMASTTADSLCSDRQDDSSTEASAIKLYSDYSIFKEEKSSIIIFSSMPTSISHCCSSGKSSFSCPVTYADNPGRRGRHTYGVQNAASQQYSKGFPFVKQTRFSNGIRPPINCHCTSPAAEGSVYADATTSPIVLTMCPPHDTECDSSNSPKNMSFDLGFTVMERNNRAYVMSVAKSSPAMVAGIKPFYKVKFAFEQNLTSPFRVSGEGPSRGSVSFLSSSIPEIAVYHPSEQESKEAADYALKCVQNGEEISFQSFCDMFPFDITKSSYCYKPAIFANAKDPILYPVTIVFEANLTHPNKIPYNEHADKFFGLTNIPLWKILFCLQN